MEGGAGGEGYGGVGRGVRLMLRSCACMFWFLGCVVVVVALRRASLAAASSMERVVRVAANSSLCAWMRASAWSFALRGVVGVRGAGLSVGVLGGVDFGRIELKPKPFLPLADGGGTFDLVTVEGVILGFLATFAGPDRPVHGDSGSDGT